MSQSASITSATEFLARRAVREMRARSAPRRFLWNVPNLGMSVVVGFRPAAPCARAEARCAQSAR